LLQHFDMLTQAIEDTKAIEDTNQEPRPSLIELLTEPEPMREARRLLVWVCAVSRRPPLDGDLVTAMTARCHAEAMCASTKTALRARDPATALRDAEHARRALLHLRAVLYVALSERLLHKVQFDILSRQAGRTKRALDALASRAAGLDAAWRRAEGGGGGARNVGDARAAARGRPGEPPSRPAARWPEEEP
jgi:hypothetical protein